CCRTNRDISPNCTITAGYYHKDDSQHGASKRFGSAKPVWGSQTCVESHPYSKQSMPKVLITPATLAGVDGLYLKLLRDAGFDIALPARTGQLTEDELLRELEGVEATIAGSEPYTCRV